MTLGTLILALGMVLGTSQLAATIPATGGAPTGTAETRYCLRVDPETGSRVATIQCRTRDEWAALDVNVDQEWAENGVRVIA
jgi:hypothetical protein